MADEYSKPPYNREIGIPQQYNWESLTSKKGSELEAHYNILLKELGKQKGMLGRFSPNRRTRYRTRRNFT